MTHIETIVILTRNIAIDLLFGYVPICSKLSCRLRLKRLPVSETPEFRESLFLPGQITLRLVNLSQPVIGDFVSRIQRDCLSKIRQREIGLPLRHEHTGYS